MRNISAVAVLVLMIGCSPSPDRAISDAKLVAPSTEMPHGCEVTTATRKGVIYDKFTIEWSKPITGGDSDYIPKSEDQLMIEPSTALGYACVTYLRDDKSRFKLKLAVFAVPTAGGDNLIHHVERSNDGLGTHVFSIFATPVGESKSITGVYYFEEAQASGDSGGTWSGGK